MSRRMGMGDLLDQGEIWNCREDGRLVTTRLADMTPSHLANLRAWLLRKAAGLHGAEVSALYGMESHAVGEIALEDLGRAVSCAEEEDPQAWIRGKPLFRAISSLLGEGRPSELLPPQAGSMTPPF